MVLQIGAAAHLLALVVNEHLVLCILLHVQHLLLLAAGAGVTLRKGAVLLVLHLLLGLLLVLVLELDLPTAHRFGLADLW